MPYSKQKQAAWMRAYRAKKKASGTALMPKALVKRLRRLGVNPERYFTSASVSLDDHRELERRFAAKVERVEWQSGGIRMLHEEVGKLRAKIATQPAMHDTEVLKRLATVEVEQAMHEALHGAESIPEPEVGPFKDLRRFIEMHNQSEREAGINEQAR